MSARRADGPSRRIVAAVGAPIALVAVAGALTLATPANAAGGSNPLPFPTSVCGTATSRSASASASATTSRSATATPQASASPSGATPSPPKAGAGQPAGPSDPPSPAASKSPASGGNGNQATPSTPPTPTPTPSASTSSSSSGGFWGWLNGVWTWIFGAVQLPHAAAAPAMNAAFVRSMSGTHSQVQQAQAAPSTSAAPTATASCVPQSAIKANTASSGGDVAAVIPWHLSTPSMTMYSLTYNGITSIKTATGSMQVLDFTASKVTLLSMVTYSQQCCGKLQYVNGGTGQTVTLFNAHLLTTSITANLLGLIHQTFTPANPGLLTVLRGITIPIPVLFTNVEADNAFLNTQTIVIPGFNGHGN